MTEDDPDEQRAALRENWEQAAPRWGAEADTFQAAAAELSTAMVDALSLTAGQRVLELAAGPGDTGFIAAQRIAPGGTLICSDGAEAMLTVARQRAAARQLTNVEFKQLELEWIDLPTADVDAVLCRWGIMLVVDPEAAAAEIRRVLKPGGHLALAVWDAPERNPWATITTRAIQEVEGLAPETQTPPGPGMFALAGEGVLCELLQSAGLVDVTVTPIALSYAYPSLDDYLEERVALSAVLRTSWNALDGDGRAAFRARVAELVYGGAQDDGPLTVAGSTLLASAGA